MANCLQATAELTSHVLAVAATLPDAAPKATLPRDYRGRKTGASRPALPSGEGQLRLRPRGNGHNPLGRSAFLATAVWPCGNGSVVDWSAATHGGAALGSSDVAWEDATETEVRV